MSRALTAIDQVLAFARLEHEAVDIAGQVLVRLTGRAAAPGRGSAG